MISLFLTLALRTQLAAAAPVVCEAPDALITLDVSGTMKQTTTAGGQTKTKFDWAKLGISNVMAAPGARGGTIAHEVSFGLSVFPTPAKFDSHGKLVAETGLCYLPNDDADFVLADFAIDNGTAIQNKLTAIGTPSGDNDTPIYQALTKAGDVGLFPANGTPRKRAVILITDGFQDCCRGPDYDHSPPDDCIPGQGDTLDPTEAANNRQDIINLTASLAAQGIKVYAVGFGDKVDPKMLGGVAKAAGTERDPACDPNADSSMTNSLCYYSVDSAGADGLELALRDIVGKIQTEECNGIDDDCNGSIDDNIPPEACGGAQCGGNGVKTCVNGDWSQCSVVLQQEVCDGKDNDCDGLVDAVPCMTACGPGLERCFGGVLDPTCHLINEVTEQCNNRDDNCDGNIDEGCDCENKAMQACKKNNTCDGVQTCVFGQWDACVPHAPESDEVCDGIDNDCNGQIDDGTALCGPDGQCVKGGCVSGVGVEGGGPSTENFVYRGQGLTRACSSSQGAPALLFLLGFFAFRRRRHQ